MINNSSAGGNSNGRVANNSNASSQTGPSLFGPSSAAAVFGGSSAANLVVQDQQQQQQQMITCPSFVQPLPLIGGNNSQQHQQVENLMNWSHLHQQQQQQHAQSSFHQQAQQQLTNALQDSLAAQTVFATVQQIRHQLGQHLPPPPPPPTNNGSGSSNNSGRFVAASSRQEAAAQPAPPTAAEEVRAFAAAWLRARSRLVVASPSSHYAAAVSSSSIVVDLTSRLSNELLETVFQYLTRSQLVTAMRVCKRWHRVILNNKSLWHAVDMSRNQYTIGQISRLFIRGMVVVRLAWSKISDSDGLLPGLSSPDLLMASPPYGFNNSYCIQYLDMTGVTISPPNLALILNGCRGLKRLSLEACELCDAAMLAIAENRDLEVLNLTMARSLSAPGLRHVLQNCRLLTELNLASSGEWLAASRNEKMPFDRPSFVFEALPPTLRALNVSGLTDLSDADALAIARSCTSLTELDLSDCRALTVTGLRSIARNLSVSLVCLGISRCFGLELADLIALTALPRLERLKVHSFGGTGADNWLAALLPATAINHQEHILSTVARPTVGDRRTSIWGLRTRDIRC